MNKLNSKWSAAIAGVALSLSIFSANSAKAVTVSFSQGGWVYGGELSGSFTGDDLNSDGIIEASELSDFRATFSGNVSFGSYTSTGEPILPFFTLSYVLPSLAPPSPYSSLSIDTFLNFSYSSSTSQLSFSSIQVACYKSPFGGCVEPYYTNQLSVSGAGGFIVFDPSLLSDLSRFSTSSSSAPIVGCAASNLR